MSAAPVGRLVSKAGEDIKVGDIVRDFRGDACTVRGWTQPRNPASTGRVLLAYSGTVAHDYYPGVIDARVLPPEENPFTDAPLLDPATNPFRHYMRKGPGFANAKEEADFLERR